MYLFKVHDRVINLISMKPWKFHHQVHWLWTWLFFLIWHKDHIIWHTRSHDPPHITWPTSLTSSISLNVSRSSQSTLLILPLPCFLVSYRHTYFTEHCIKVVHYLSESNHLTDCLVLWFSWSGSLHITISNHSWPHLQIMNTSPYTPKVWHSDSMGGGEDITHLCLPNTVTTVPPTGTALRGP